MERTAHLRLIDALRHRNAVVILQKLVDRDAAGRCCLRHALHLRVQLLLDGIGEGEALLLGLGKSLLHGPNLFQSLLDEVFLPVGALLHVQHGGGGGVHALQRRGCSRVQAQIGDVVAPLVQEVIVGVPIEETDLSGVVVLSVHRGGGDVAGDDVGVPDRRKNHHHSQSDTNRAIKEIAAPFLFLALCLSCGLGGGSPALFLPGLLFS